MARRSLANWPCVVYQCSLTVARCQPVQRHLADHSPPRLAWCGAGLQRGVIGRTAAPPLVCLGGPGVLLACCRRSSWWAAVCGAWALWLTASVARCSALPSGFATLGGLVQGLRSAAGGVQARSVLQSSAARARGLGARLTRSNPPAANVLGRLRFSEAAGLTGLAGCQFGGNADPQPPASRGLFSFKAAAVPGVSA
jgi:hypothetical protein